MPRSTAPLAQAALAARAPAGRRAVARALPAALVALVSSCGASVDASVAHPGVHPVAHPGAAPGSPRWQHLADGFVPAPVASRELAGFRPAARLVPDGVDAWLETELEREEWVGDAHLGVWVAPAPWRGFGTPGRGTPSARLRLGDLELVGVPGEKPVAAARGRGAGPGSFHYDGRLVRMWLGPGAEPPARATLAVWAGRGNASGSRWSVAGRPVVEGLPVWPGERVERRVELRGADALSYGVEVRPVARDLARERERGEVVFRVLCDGVALDEVRLAAGRSIRQRRVALPARSGPATLSFEVSGPFAYSAFLAPVVGPLELGVYGDRPWSDPAERPDVVVFQADTFRADNLAAYGATPGLTPNVDALAADGVVFTEARSTATYTLPAHASIFTGLQPRNAGITLRRSRLSSDVLTLAEHFRSSGYRTVAITDGALVSEDFGFERGFEWFDELGWVDPGGASMERTLRLLRQRLEADDGRPLFLFVQSYRVHSPYRVSDATRAAWRERLDLSSSYHELIGRIVHGDRVAEAYDELHDHYLGAVADFDHDFGEVLAVLRERNLYDSGILLFLSDHGEAFFEHGHGNHGGPVHEELIRIPLILRAPGMRPGRDPRSASLVDVFPTLVDLTGLPVPAGLQGRSLVGPPAQRPVYAFQVGVQPSESTVAIVKGGRKLLLTEGALGSPRAVFASYDLRADPGETDDLGAPSWAVRLFQEVHAELLGCLVPPARVEAAHPSPETLRALRALGYADLASDPD